MTSLQPPWTVLLTIPNFVTAGSGKALVNVVERLDRNLFTPIVGVRYIAGNQLEARLDASNVPVIEIDLSIPPKPYSTLPYRSWRASSTLRQQKVALVHSYDYGDSYTEALATRTAGARYVSTKKNMGWGSRAWLLRSVMSHRIAVQNVEMLRQFYGGHILRPRTRYIPPGVDTEFFLTSEVMDLRERLRIPADAVVVCCVANILENKNQLLLIRAIAPIAKAHLLLVGPELDHVYGEKLRVEALEMGIDHRVHFVGHVDDVRPALRASDIFALVSRAEGSPIALLEAMSVGLPVLASRIPGVHELVDGSGAAILVGPDDLVGAMNALQTMVDDSSVRAAMAQCAQSLVRERRSIDVEVARIESMYLELLWEGS